MNGNFKPVSCSQPNPRGDLSLAAVGQKRVGWAASDSSFPCQKVSKASHTFPSSLRQKNTMPPLFEARLLLPVASKPRGKPLPPVGAHGTPAPWGKRLRGERPPTKSAGERQGGREVWLLEDSCTGDALTCLFPPIRKEDTMGQRQLLNPSESRGLPGSPFPMGHGQGGHLQLSLPLLVPHPCVQTHRFPPGGCQLPGPPSRLRVPRGWGTPPVHPSPS